MADDEPTGSTPAQDALLFFGALIILAMLWYFAGGPGKADLKGLFLAPPPPLGTGEAYGPQFGESTTTPKVDAPAPLEEYNQ